MSKTIKENERQLLNTGDVLVFAFGAMIGWGWVVLSGQWIVTGGIIGTAIGFLIGGFMIYFVGLCYAELTTSIPQSGGIKVFSYLALGEKASFMCTWAIILSYISVVCFEVVSFPTVLQYIFPNFSIGRMYTILGADIYISWTLVSVIMALAVTVMNLVGTKTAARFQKIMTLAIAGVGVLLIAGAVFSGNVQNLDNQLFLGMTESEAIEGIAKISILTPFFLFGFDVIPQIAEEIKIPMKKIGKLMMMSIVLAVAFYVLVVFSVGFILSKTEILYSMEHTGLVTADAMAKAFNSVNMAKIVIVGGMCGILTSWNSFLIGGSRALCSLSASNMLPSLFGVTSKKTGVPIYTISFIGLISIISAFFGKAILTWFVDAGNFSCCVAYCIVSVSFLMMRKKYKALKRLYEVKHYKIVGGFAVFLSGLMAGLYIIPGTSCTLSFPEVIIMIIWSGLGLIFYLYCKKRYATKIFSDIDDSILMEKN